MFVKFMIGCALLLGVILFVVLADEVLPSKAIGKAQCEVVETTELVTTSEQKVTKELQSGKTICAGDSAYFRGRKSLPMGRDNFGKVAFGQKWQCDGYESLIFRKKNFKACVLN